MTKTTLELLEAPEPTYEGRPVPKVPRDSGSGALTDTLSLDDAITLYGHNNSNFRYRPNRYYASMLMNCFRKRWFSDKNAEAERHNADVQRKRDAINLLREHLDESEVRSLLARLPTMQDLPWPADDDFYPTGLAEPGNATEQHLTWMFRNIYGYQGRILQDIRFNLPLKGDDGEDVWVICKTDPLIMGDNLEPLHLFEVKSSIWWKKAMSDLTNALGSKQVPLTAAKIETPDDPKGLVNVNQIVQLAMEAKAMGRRDLAPKKRSLLYVDRSDYRNHMDVMPTQDELEYLAGLGEWWALEHHENLKKEEPPEPRWFMRYECKYCSFKEHCDKMNEGKKQPTHHPIMVGLNDRLADINGSDPDA